MVRNVSEETDPPPDEFVSTISTNPTISAQDRFYWGDIFDTGKLPWEAKR